MERQYSTFDSQTYRQIRVRRIASRIFRPVDNRGGSKLQQHISGQIWQILVIYQGKYRKSEYSSIHGTDWRGTLKYVLRYEEPEKIGARKIAGTA